MTGGEVDLAKYSQALDEIFALRRLLAYEAHVVQVTYGRSGMSQSTRRTMEAQVTRMHQAARGEWDDASREIASSVLRHCLLETGAAETLTRSAWEAERA